MTLSDLLQSLGLRPDFLLAGALGGALRAFSRQRLKVREVLLAPLCGVLAAAYLPLPVVHYIKAMGLPMPADEMQTALAAAFALGMCAMHVADWLLEGIVRYFKPKPPT